MLGSGIFRDPVMGRLQTGPTPIVQEVICLTGYAIKSIITTGLAAANIELTGYVVQQIISVGVAFAKANLTGKVTQSIQVDVEITKEC